MQLLREMLWNNKLNFLKYKKEIEKCPAKMKNKKWYDSNF